MDATMNDPETSELLTSHDEDEEGDLASSRFASSRMFCINSDWWRAKILIASLQPQMIFKSSPITEVSHQATPDIRA